MPEFTRYVTHLETKVTVVAYEGSSEQIVGEFTVRAKAGGDSNTSSPIRHMTDRALERIGKLINVMGAGVQNTENNRRK